MRERKQELCNGDRLKQLRAFCQVARLGSISRAADHLLSSQPAVSQQINKIEREVGRPLILRSGQSIQLTSAGQHLYEIAMPLVKRMDRLINTFSEEFRGGITESFNVATGQILAYKVLPKYLKRFETSYPNVQINIVIATYDEMLHLLGAYEVDVAFSAVQVTPNSFNAHTICYSDMVIISGDDHPPTSIEQHNMIDLGSHTLFTPTQDDLICEFLQMLINEKWIEPREVIEIDGWEQIKHCVSSGDGVAIVPAICLDDSDLLHRRRITEYFPPMQYAMLTRPDEFMSLSAKHFIHIVLDDIVQEPQSC